MSCTGAGDDSAGVAQAFAAARHNAFVLVVDCPVRIKVGTDIAHSVFIDNGTSVEFSGAGKFTVDNLLIPAFVIANATDITLTNWNVQYDASLPVDELVNYEENGSIASGDKPGNAFNDLRLTQWLAKNRGIVFDRSHGPVNAEWAGTTPACAVFYITGDSSNVRVSGMRLYVPAAAGGDHFIPVAFSLSANFRSSQTVNAQTPLTAKNFAVPHNLTFSNITLDGTYMGWVGELQNATFQTIRSERYGDLQDANGRHVGGLAKWFAPPHLFYFSYDSGGDSGLFNSNVHIKDVVDQGIRIGKARDAGGSDTISGYANSLKLGCVNCSVDNYESHRPDGLMDILNSEGLSVTNVTATYDSTFANNMYPAWRFPASSYRNLKFDNINITDVASVTTRGAIGSAGVLDNQDIVMTNVHVTVNKLAVPNPFPAIAGESNTVSMQYLALDTQAEYLQAQTGTVELELRVTPATTRVGEAAEFKYLSRQANSCSGSGAWSGVGTSGSRIVKMTTAGTFGFTYACRNSNSATSTTMAVLVAP